MLAIKSNVYFKTSCVQEILDDVCVRNKEIPSCLDNGNVADPLEIVFVMTSQTAIELAQAVATVEVNSAIEAFHRQITRQVGQMPVELFKEDTFFLVDTVESVMTRLDSCDQDFSTFMASKPATLPKEVVITLTYKFASSIYNVLKRTRPVGILNLFANRLKAVLGGMYNNVEAQ